jgi:uncharacterized protein YndB with AHSA1/START domain
VSLTIAARPGTVFRHFTDPARFARWNVAGTDLDGRFRWVTGFWDPPAEAPEPPQRP